MTDNMPELKPCPFCGCTPKAISVCDTTAMVGITCPDHSSCKGSGLLNALGERDGSLDKAIAQWNTRADKPAKTWTRDELCSIVGNYMLSMRRGKTYTPEFITVEALIAAGVIEVSE